MASLLKGVGFITGAASGIGKATAFSFAKHGARALAIGDLNSAAIQDTAAELKEDFPNIEVLPLQLDVGDEGSIDEVVAQAASKFGRIDYAVNNAGVGGDLVPSAGLSSSDWQRVVNINLSGVWKSSRAEIRQMLKQQPLESNSVRYNRGTIVNMASMYGLIATPLNIPAVAYTATKHGVIGLTKADAIAYAREGIRINAMCPGYIATPLLKEATASEAMQREIERTPAGRIGEMEEIADTITFMVSPMSSFMYGAGLVADGGFTIQ
ncbi:hypothetical protein PV11_05177 [Exophiala sideris]|uniref:Uncharacterized protein n=2 Tax=Exophiala sideris TaxID=1016849 RepID=A0A0D1YPF3_9EURO|nr:hypothetical protein PV11_05177 [Exophiala sideris]